ncbi:hypothetical protein pb186bvf_003441 [Paramecium bursaria]
MAIHQNQGENGFNPNKRSYLRAIRSPEQVNVKNMQDQLRQEGRKLLIFNIKTQINFIKRININQNKDL